MKRNLINVEQKSVVNLTTAEMLENVGAARQPLLQTPKCSATNFVTALGFTARILNRILQLVLKFYSYQILVILDASLQFASTTSVLYLRKTFNSKSINYKLSG